MHNCVLLSQKDNNIIYEFGWDPRTAYKSLKLALKDKAKEHTIAMDRDFFTKVYASYDVFQNDHTRMREWVLMVGSKKQQTDNRKIFVRSSYIVIATSTKKIWGFKQLKVEVEYQITKK